MYVILMHFQLYLMRKKYFPWIHTVPNPVKIELLEDIYRSKVNVHMTVLENSK